jgi:hypothetical protein
VEWQFPTRVVFIIMVATAVALWWLQRFHFVVKEPLWLLVVAIGVGYSRRGWPILPCARTRTPPKVCNVSVRLSHRTAKEFEDAAAKQHPHR